MFLGKQRIAPLKFSENQATKVFLFLELFASVGLNEDVLVNQTTSFFDWTVIYYVMLF